MRTSKGFTLTEILVSLVVVSIGLLALSTISLVAVNEFHFTRSKIDAMNESLKMNLLLTSYFGQAVKVQTVVPPTASNTGGILSFNYFSMASAPGDFTLVASFMRDVGGRSISVATPPDVNGDYQPAGIWWRRPSATTAGVLFFYTGPGGDNRPSYANQFVTRLTELSFTPEFSRAGIPPSSVAVRAVFRYSRPNAANVWCPDAEMAGVASCANMSVVDMEKRYRIILRNNITAPTSATGVLLPERPLGLIYFFNPAVPTSWSN